MTHRKQADGSDNSRNDSLKDFFRSVRLGKVNDVRRHVEDGNISVNTKDDWDNSPLYLACLCGHKAVVKYLLEKGARYDSENIESQRCFLASLTESIRELLKQYESSLVLDSSHGSVTDLKFVDYLKRLYERVPDFDIQLVVKGHLYLAHRCILSVRCRYFANLIQESGMKNEGMLTLPEDVFKTDVFGPMLHFIYTGRLDVDKKHKKDLIKLARFLQFDSLAEVLTNDKSLEMIRHNQFLKDLKSDFGCLVSTAIPPSILPPTKGEPDNVVKNTYSDVVFDVQGHSFKCHKIFFYGRSEFFREMLIDKGEEQPPAFGDYSPCIRLENISADVFLQIVNYVYQDKYDVNMDNCIELLKAGTLYVIPHIKKRCMEEISKFLYPSNFLDIYQSAEDLDMPRLKNNCLKYMAEKLEEVIEMPEFECFVRQQLAPLMRDGTPFDQIQFFLDIQYYLRGECTTWLEKKEANEKLQKFNYLLTHKIGVDVSLPMFDIDDNGPTCVVVDGRTPYDLAREKEYKRRKQKEKDRSDYCIIL